MKMSVAYIDIHVSRLLKEEQAWATDKWLHIISNVTVTPLETAKSLLSRDHPAKETGFIFIIIITYYSVVFPVVIDMHGNSRSRRALSIENDFHLSPYLQL